MKTLEETILEFLEKRSYLQNEIIEPLELPEIEMIEVEPLELPEIEMIEIEPLPLCGGSLSS